MTYDFFTFCKTGEFKECPTNDYKFYPCIKKILIRWGEEFNKSELLRIADKIKMGHQTIKPQHYFDFKRINKRKVNKEKKINFNLLCYK